jgi:exonuclease SbcC
VLDQLDHLRSGGRVVGVISHVTEMKERIPDRIQVIPQPDHTSIVNQVPEAADQLA